jgi:hypothetical protein
VRVGEYFILSRTTLPPLQSTNITHNEIWNASDGSIESGWGWGGGDYATNNSITHNKIVNSNWVGVHARTTSPPDLRSTMPPPPPPPPPPLPCTHAHTHVHILLCPQLLVDCGSIYVNGVNDGSVIAYNYCANQTQKFGALYPDEGSSLWNIHDNVVDNCVEWLHICE